MVAALKSIQIKERGGGASFFKETIDSVINKIMPPAINMLYSWGMKFASVLRLRDLLEGLQTLHKVMLGIKLNVALVGCRI